ncbi:MAG TPA: DUF2934 domain-containing protein [Bryobacteraceae bacterium]|nr:DUF2934 domain-containing protein [Bryobacteraceae bacterium]
MGANRALWNEYRATWNTFSRSLDQLQSCVESGNRNLVEEALLAVETAKTAHNAARDRLAAGLSGDVAAADRAEVRSEEHRIREKAQLLWELAGKPQGSAEADWFGAERLVRSASASSAS